MRGKGDNKMYAFVNFRTKEMASKAIQKLNNKDLKVCLIFMLFHASDLLPLFILIFFTKKIWVCVLKQVFDSTYLPNIEVGN